MPPPSSIHGDEAQRLVLVESVVAHLKGTITDKLDEIAESTRTAAALLHIHDRTIAILQERSDVSRGDSQELKGRMTKLEQDVSARLEKIEKSLDRLVQQEAKRNGERDMQNRLSDRTWMIIVALVGTLSGVISPAIMQWFAK